MKYTLLSLVFGVASAATTSSELAVPTPGATCKGNVAYCAGMDTNIILRCGDGKIYPGNCNDNEGEPSQGALCNSYAPSQATCSIVGSSSNMTTSVISTTATIAPVTTGSIAEPTKSNTTHSMASPSVPVQTGAAAAKVLSWSDAIMALVVAGAGLGL